MRSCFLRSGSCKVYTATSRSPNMTSKSLAGLHLHLNSNSVVPTSLFAPLQRRCHHVNVSTNFFYLEHRSLVLNADFFIRPLSTTPEGNSKKVEKTTDAGASATSDTSDTSVAKYMYMFGAILVGANVFTVWQEYDAHDLAEQRRADYEANKKAWEERERRETEQIEKMKKRDN